LWDDSGVSGAAFGVELTKGQLAGSIYESAGPGAAIVFRTFCVENEIPFPVGTKLWASIDSVAYSGADGGGAAGDPVSAVTEWIYDQYLSGTVADLAAIRDAIHYAEGEITSWSGADADAEGLFNAALASAGSGNALHTYALNLWQIMLDASGAYRAIDKQSHLITVVPVPATLLLGLLGLGYAGTKLRKLV
jgi:hypothetical protein